MLVKLMSYRFSTQKKKKKKLWENKMMLKERKKGINNLNKCLHSARTKKKRLQLYKILFILNIKRNKASPTSPTPFAWDLKTQNCFCNTFAFQPTLKNQLVY